MATASRARVRKPSKAKGNRWGPQAQGLTAIIARSAGDVSGHVTSSWQTFVPWWHAQSDHLRLSLVVVGLVATISVLNLASAGIGRGSQTAHSPSSAAAPSVRVLMSESAPTDQGKAWVATQLWQGSTSRATESFSVSAHWRVDWVYNPPPSGGILQVFIYSADGALLMNMAANTQQSGADSSFWAGSGTYFLKINSTGGDWKLDVQDLH